MREKISRIGIGPRLIGAFLIVALVTLASGVIGLLSLQRAFTAADRLVQDAEMIQAVQEVRVAFGPLLGPPGVFLLTGDPAAPARYSAALADVRARLATYAQAHGLHRHSAEHAASAHDLIAQAERDVLAMERLAPRIFAAPTADEAAAALRELEALTAAATARLEVLLHNAQEDITAAEAAQAAAQRSARLGLATSALLAFALAVGLGLFSARRITRPLAHLATASGRIAEGDLSASMRVEGPGEIGRLARAFERMRRMLVREREQVRLLAVLEERDRIGREMHDGLAQVLGYVNTKAQAVREHLKAGQPALAERNIDELVSAAREAYTDAREVIVGLRIDGMGERGLAELLEEYVGRFRRQSGVAAELTLDPAWDDRVLSPAVKVQLLRVVQEALTNVRKHAAAQTVRIRLGGAAGQVEIGIEDDGRGFYLSRLLSPDYAHYGLRTMRERAQAVGGTFRVESMPGRGTRILVRAPFEQPAEERRR